MSTQTLPNSYLKKFTADMLATLALILSLGIGMLLAYWAVLDTSAPVEQKTRGYYFYESPDAIKQGKPPVELVKAGQYIYRQINFCVPEDEEVQAINRTRIVDGFVLELPDRYLHYNSGCYDIVVPLKIPAILTPGNYRIVAQIEYFLNPFQQAFGSGVRSSVQEYDITVIE